MKSLKIRKTSPGKDGAAQTYHQLGLLLEDLNNLKSAKIFYMAAISISKCQKDKTAMASSYLQLGVVEHKNNRIEHAMEMYSEALKIDTVDFDYNRAFCFHQLGMLEKRRGNFNEANIFLIDALKIRARFQDDFNVATTYGELGNVALEMKNWDAAEAWFKCALPIFDRLDPHYAEVTRNNLSRVAQARTASSPHQP